MAEYIAIPRPNGGVALIRSKLETSSEEPLHEYEKIINELWAKVNKQQS